MSDGKIWASGMMMSFAAVFAVAAFVDNNHKIMADRKAAAANVLSVPVAEVIGSHYDFQGDPKSPYTLVEFGDYQCPPCHLANSSVQELLVENHGKIRFIFRNLPLTTIHQYAMQAALDAEAARSLNKFWQVHDGFYNIDSRSFTSKTVDAVVRNQHFDMPNFKSVRTTAAKSAVKADIDEANKLNITGTPSFILCKPDGKVIRLQSIDQVQTLL